MEAVARVPFSTLPLRACIVHCADLIGNIRFSKSRVHWDARAELMRLIECVAQHRPEFAWCMNVQKSTKRKRCLRSRRARESLQYRIDVTEVVMRARVRCLYCNRSDRAV